MCMPRSYVCVREWDREKRGGMRTTTSHDDAHVRVKFDVVCVWPRLRSVAFASVWRCVCVYEHRDID